MWAAVAGGCGKSRRGRGKRTSGAKARTHFLRLNGTTEVVPFPRPALTETGQAPSLHGFFRKWLSAGLLLDRQQLLLALYAPAIASQFAILPHYSVAGDCYCYGVGGAGSGYGSSGFGHADLFGHGAVGARFSSGNFLQRFPDPALKGCRPYV